jgi:ABC-type transport system involved in Fe-S cluster assembly fused permease/ATPase subunit
MWVLIRRWMREKVPWLIILVLLYHLFKVKVNFFSVKFKDYKNKAISIANSIKVENSLDFKFLLFSQFMRLLFSTIALP